MSLGTSILSEAKSRAARTAEGIVQALWTASEAVGREWKTFEKGKPHKHIMDVVGALKKVDELTPAEAKTQRYRLEKIIKYSESQQQKWGSLWSALKHADNVMKEKSG